MIVIIHNGKNALTVLNENLLSVNHILQPNETVSQTVLNLAKAHPNELLVWCHETFKEHLNIEAFSSIFHHKCIFASFNPSHIEYLPEQIGYIERSFYLKINKEKTFATWLMSDLVGGIFSSTFLKFEKIINTKSDFNYVLNSIAKMANTEGLFCYSEPELLKRNIELPIEQATTRTLFQFVKQHYKWVWTWYLLLSYMLFEKRFPFFPFLSALFFSQKQVSFNLEDINIKSTKKVVDHREIDVIIPTIGRKQYLFDVLKDFTLQTVLPKRIIIVEQNPDPESVSELDFLNEEWPFQIIHHFTHQAGVVNARNLALSEVKSEWTFLGDDDNRFQSDLIEKLFDAIERYGVKVGITVYLQPKEVQTYTKTAQTTIFGAGNAILKSELLNGVSFNERYEFNYGEDTDFGMQLRRLGEDVIFFADIKITHLKAPIGGYRTKVKQLWDDDVIKPKPSPTIQLLYKNYFTNQQLLGYKLLLVFRNLKSRGFKNPVAYIKMFKRQWQRSEYWCQQLIKSSND